VQILHRTCGFRRLDTHEQVKAVKDEKILFLSQHVDKSLVAHTSSLNLAIIKTAVQTTVLGRVVRDNSIDREAMDWPSVLSLRRGFRFS
jgi:hypothetical protein